jgi:uncharacterized membrane protein SirB2
MNNLDSAERAVRNVFRHEKSAVAQTAARTIVNLDKTLLILGLVTIMVAYHTLKFTGMASWLIIKNAGSIGVLAMFVAMIILFVVVVRILLGHH